MEMDAVIAVGVGATGCAVLINSLLSLVEPPRAAPHFIRAQLADADCVYSDWTTARPCQGTCAGANLVQQRYVVGGGTNCAGPLTQTVSCAPPAGTCQCTKDSLATMIVGEPSAVTFCNGFCDVAEPGQSCQIGCADPWIHTGPSQITCQPNGQWAWNDAYPAACTAKPIQCPTIAESGSMGILPSQATQCANAPPGSKCQVFCHVGFAPASQTTVTTCLASGSWSDAVQCVPQSCFYC
jgi:hypothetical protein